jgi:hypothetical protein
VHVPARLRLPCGSSREAGLKAMQAMTQNYATLVGGVLIGLLEALEQGEDKTLTPSLSA